MEMMTTGESEDDASAEVYAKPELHHLKPILQKHHFTLLKKLENTKPITEKKNETPIRNNSGSSFALSFTKLALPSPHQTIVKVMEKHLALQAGVSLQYRNRSFQ